MKPGKTHTGPADRSGPDPAQAASLAAEGIRTQIAPAPVRCRWLAAGAAMLWACAAPATPFGMLLVDDSSGAIDYFASPTINDAGRIAYAATFDAAAGQGLYVRAPGTAPTVIATSVGPFARFGGAFINNSGSTAFTGWRDDGTAGVFKWKGGSLTPLASKGGSLDFVDFSGTGSINDRENVVFEGWTGGSSPLGAGAGIFATFPVAVGDVAHTRKDIYSGFGTGRMDINNRGQVAFYATVADPATAVTAGIFREGIGGGVVTIADNRASSKFSGMGTDVDSVNDSNTVAFVGLLKTGRSGVYTGSGGAIATVADSGGAFRYFHAPHVNNAGSVAFVGELDSGGTGIYTGPDPVANKVIAVGDALFGSTVTDVATVMDQNNAGMITFIADLADSREVLGRADPVGSSPFFAALADTGTGLAGDPLTYRFTCPTCTVSTQSAGLGNAVPIYLDVPVVDTLHFAVSGDRFTTLALPAGIGGAGGLLQIVAAGETRTVAAGTRIDLTEIVAGGLDEFILSGLAPPAPGTSDTLPNALMQSGLAFARGGVETVVTIRAAVPEPMALALVLPGMLLLAMAVSPVGARRV